MGCSGVSFDHTKIIKALKQCKGRVVHAAKAAGCSEVTIYKYAKLNPEVKKALDEAREEYDAKLVEKACDALLNKVEAEETTAVIFSLRTKGKHLGFSQENNIVINQQIPFANKGGMDLPDDGGSDVK